MLPITQRKPFRMTILLVAVTLIALYSVVLAEDTIDPLEALTAEIIPREGTETFYGTPLSLESLPQFVGWWYTLVPQAESDPRYAEALQALVAPCCDDNQAFRCCCESDEGQACNIIRSGKGLAAHLILDLDATADQVQSSVLEWFRYARPDYYLAAGLAEQNVDPAIYGLTVGGSCYRGLCNTPISEGGCGGMVDLIEPAIGLSG